MLTNGMFQGTKNFAQELLDGANDALKKKYVPPRKYVNTRFRRAPSLFDKLKTAQPPAAAALAPAPAASGGMSTTTKVVLVAAAAGIGYYLWKKR